MAKNLRLQLFFCGLFSAFLITGNFIAGKLIDVWVFTVPVAVIIFPFCFVISDCINEFWGVATTKTVIIQTFIFNAVIVGVVSLGIIIPASEYSGVSYEAFSAVFGTTWRMLGASVIAFVAGGFTNAYIFAKIKRAGSLLPVRSAVSSLAGILLDSFIFITVAFAGNMPFGDLMFMVLGQSILKIAVGVVIGTPLTVLCVRLLKRHIAPNGTP